MVTQEQVIQVEQQLTSQQQQFTQARQQLQAQKILFTRQQRKLPRQQRRLLQSRFQQQKQQSLQALRKQERAFQQEISPVQSQLESAKAGLRLQQEYEYGRKMARRGVVDPAFTKMMKRGYRGELSRIEYSSALIKQRAALKGLGGFQTITGEIQYLKPSGEIVYRIPAPEAFSPSTIDPTTEAMPTIESAGLSARAIELRQELIAAVQPTYTPVSLPERKIIQLGVVPDLKKVGAGVITYYGDIFKTDIKYIGERLAKLPKQILSFYRDVSPKVVPQLKEIGVGVSTQIFKTFPTPEKIKRKVVTPFPFIVPKKIKYDFPLDVPQIKKDIRYFGETFGEGIKKVPEQLKEGWRGLTSTRIDFPLDVPKIKKDIRYFGETFGKGIEMFGVGIKKVGVGVSTEIFKTFPTPERLKRKIIAPVPFIVSERIITQPPKVAPVLKGMGVGIRYFGETFGEGIKKVPLALKGIGAGVSTQIFKTFPTPERLKRELTAPLPFIVSEREVKELERGRRGIGGILTSGIPRVEEKLDILAMGAEERKRKEELSLITEDMPLSEIKEKYYFSYPDIVSERESEKQQKRIDIYSEELGIKLSKEIQKGSITEQEAKTKYELLIEKEVEKGTKIISDVTTKARKDVIEKQELYKMPARFGTALGIRTLAPPVAVGLGIFYTAVALTRTPKEYKEMWGRRKELILGTIPWIAGGIVGAKLGKLPALSKFKGPPLFKPKTYPFKPPKPTITGTELRKSISPAISKSLFEVKVEYPAWRGTIEAPLQRALRLKPLVTLPKIFVPSPTRVTTIAQPRAYTLITPRAVTTYKGMILPSKIYLRGKLITEYPKVEITRAGAKYKVVGELKGELIGIGEAGIKKLEVPSKILFKMGKKPSIFPKKVGETQLGWGEASFEPLYRVRLGEISPYYTYIKGKGRLTAKAKVKSILVSKSQEFETMMFGEKRPATISEIGFKELGERAKLRVRKIDIMRGPTYDLLTGEKLILATTKKIKPLEIAALVPKETLFQKLTRQFPKKYWGKRGGNRFSRTNGSCRSIYLSHL